MLGWHCNTAEQFTAVVVLPPGIQGQQRHKGCHLEDEVHEHSQSSVQSKGLDCWHGGQGPLGSRTETRFKVNTLYGNTMVPSHTLYVHRTVLKRNLLICPCYLLHFVHVVFFTLKKNWMFLPKKKQTDSERLHRSMLGATFPRTRPMCSSLFSPGLRTSLCKEGRVG